jgi:hypothetical protein
MMIRKQVASNKDDDYETKLQATKMMMRKKAHTPI